jgi:hypothetical protein
MQVWFYFKVPLLWSPSPGRGKGIFALHSYMTALDFVTEPPFECPDGDAGDVVEMSLRSIWSMGFPPLSVSFNLGEIVDDETPMSKITLPLLDFPVAKFPQEMDDHFLVRGSKLQMYAHGEQDACIVVVPIMG